MTYGIEVFNSAGEKTFSTEELEAHYIGTYTPTTRSGSYTPPVAANVTHLWATSGAMWGVGFEHIGVWVSGKTIHWQMYFGKVGQGLKIYYGGYSK